MGARGEEPPERVRLLEEGDILGLLPLERRDAIGIHEVFAYLDKDGDKHIRALYRTLRSVAVLFPDNTTVFAEAQADSEAAPQPSKLATLGQFWRYAEIVGLQHVGELPELTRLMPRAGGARLSPAQQKLRVTDFALGLAEIASALCTCRLTAKYFGIGAGDSLVDRLGALV